MKETIRLRAEALGFDLCRFTTADPPETAANFLDWLEQGRHGAMSYLARNAHKRIAPREVLPGAQSIITLAVSYHHEAPPHAAAAAAVPASFPPQRSSSGLVARYARHQDYHALLAEKLKSLAHYLHELGGPQTRSLWYVDTGPLLERDLAQRSGLGFVGKHTNVISRQLGNWIILSEILTTLPLPPDSPEHNRCGSCVRCLEACPTGAITGPFQLDARLCISYLTIEFKGPIPIDLRPALGDRIFGCDDCLAACPWNRFAREGRLMKAAARPELERLDLLQLLHLDEIEFKKRFAGTPILRAKRRGLLRNVCVALGNVGDVSALPHLERAAADPDPLVAEHATWAIEQIKTRSPSPPD